MEVGGLVIVGLAVYVVVVYILEETRHPRRRPHPTTSEPDTTVEPLVTAAPVASAAPTTTAVPIATAVPTTKTTPAPPANVDCRAEKKKCLDRCSDTALPSGNHGFRFWNCVNHCMTAAGC